MLYITILHFHMKLYEWQEEFFCDDVWAWHNFLIFTSRCVDQLKTSQLLFKPTQTNYVYNVETRRKVKNAIIFFFLVWLMMCCNSKGGSVLLAAVFGGFSLHLKCVVSWIKVMWLPWPVLLIKSALGVQSEQVWVLLHIQISVWDAFSELIFTTIMCYIITFNRAADCGSVVPGLQHKKFPKGPYNI